MGAELDLDDIVGSFGTELAKKELTQLRTALMEAKKIMETGLSFHADIFGFTKWLEKYGGDNV